MEVARTTELPRGGSGMRGGSEVRLLGPVELFGAHSLLALPGGRQRAVLAALAMEPNHVVPMEQLVDTVWETAPPASARGQIHICISALRKLIDEGGCSARIVTHRPGYRLDIDEDLVDSHRFESLVARARALEEDGLFIEARLELREALGLWRGAALSDLNGDVIRRAAARLDDRRIAAEIKRINVELILDRPADVVMDLRRLVDENPLREELYGYLMLALYRSGRQAEALEAYHWARGVLINELGVEPSDALHALQRAILNRDQSIDLPWGGGSLSVRRHRQPSAGAWVPPRELPAGNADFVGRKEVLAEIGRVLCGEEEDGEPARFQPIVAISGPGGIGKTSLAVHAAHRLSARFPDGQLYADLRDSAIGPQPTDVLGRFLRSLGVPPSAIPDDIEARTALFRSRLADRRLLVVLDDVRSEEQVLPLLPGAAGCAVLVTSRTRLSGLPGAYWIQLSELDHEQSMRLLERLVSTERVAEEKSAAEELVALCEGLPLALRIAGARLVAMEHWRISDFVGPLSNEATMLDALSHRGMELRLTIGHTYRSLPARSQRLFDLLALPDSSVFSDWVSAALLDSDMRGALEVLDSLVEANLIDVLEEHTGRYRINRLIRAYAKEQLMSSVPASEREQVLGRWFGAWLTRVDHAHKMEYGGDYTVLHGGAVRWSPPGAGAGFLPREGIVDLDSERGQLISAIRQAATSGWDEVCWDLALTSITLFEARGLLDEWREAATLSLTATVQSDNPRGSAAMHYALGARHLARRNLPDAAAEFAVALEYFEQVGDTHGRGLTLRNLAYLDRLAGNADGMMNKYDQALDIMRAVGDRMGEAHVLQNVAQHAIDRGELAQAQEMLEQALTTSTEVGCERGESQSLCGLAKLFITKGDFDQVSAVLGRALQIVRRIGDKVGEAYTLFHIGLAMQFQGQYDSAVTAFGQARDCARRAGEQQVEAAALHQLAEVAVERGRPMSARQLCAEAVELAQPQGASVWRARTLILSAEVEASLGAVVPARRFGETASTILATQTSQEARELSERLDQLWSVVSQETSDSREVLDSRLC